MNILNKQLWAAKKGWSSSLGVGGGEGGLRTSYPEKQQRMLQNVTWGLKFGELS